MDDEAIARKIYSKIKADATVKTLTSAVYYPLAPDTAVFPYITFWIVSGVSRHLHRNESLGIDLWQIDVRDNNPQRINRLEKAVIDVFATLVTLAAGTVIDMAFLQDARIGIRSEYLDESGNPSFVKSIQYQSWTF